MSSSPYFTEIQVENVTFPSEVKPPASTKTHFLGGAGVRGLEIEGKFIKFTAIGVYLEDSAVPSLAVKWKGKSAQELTDSMEFFRDIVTGPFEKFIRVTMILPLTGQQYSEKVAENCVAFWKSMGLYTDAEAKAIQKFQEVFKEEKFPPRSSILFTLLPHGSLAISFSKDGSIPEVENAVIENKLLSDAVLESIVGKQGVSPEAKQSLAARLSAHFTTSLSVTGIEVDAVKFPPAANPPASTKTHFLGGAGARGLEIEGKYIKFTAIGVYLEDCAVPTLAVKWKGKSAQVLMDSVEFFRDIVTGPFEKFIRVTMILPLTGQQYSEKVAENCVAFWKSVGLYTDAEAKAIERFLEVFKEEKFPPGSSILFTQLPCGSLAVSFSKDQTQPEVAKSEIDNKLLSEAVLESIIGRHGVSPEAKQSLARRLSDLFERKN